MTALAHRIEEKLQRLDANTASRVEQLILELLTLAGKEQAKPVPTSVAYRTPSHHLGVNPDLDMNKLGQLSEDY